LGVDLGTTYVAAAVATAAGSEMVTLGDTAVVEPAVVYADDDGRLLFGETALGRALQRPDRLVCELETRVGSPTGVLVCGRSYPVSELLGAMLHHVVRRVSEERGAKPAGVMLTHPAGFGPYRREEFEQVAVAAGVPDAQMIAEPAAAAVYYAASKGGLADGETLAVYDLGGGTFDATVVQRRAEGIVVLGSGGIEHLGGTNFDEAIFEHCNVVTAGPCGSWTTSTRQPARPPWCSSRRCGGTAWPPRRHCRATPPPPSRWSCPASIRASRSAARSSNA
jgi:molecular chaperone DnaK (HSP70)